MRSSHCLTHATTCAQVRPSPDSLFDLVERGESRECLSPKCLLPAASRYNWHRCYVVKESKEKFRMYDERSGKLLLSARKASAHAAAGLGAAGCCLGPVGGANGRGSVRFAEKHWRLVRSTLTSPN